MRVLWTSSALDDVECLGDHIRQFNVPAADRIVSIILDQVETLAMYPKRGRRGRVEDTRELIVSGTAFIVAYRASEDLIEILAVFHGAQQWPDAF